MSCSKQNIIQSLLILKLLSNKGGDPTGDVMKQGGIKSGEANKSNICDPNAETAD